MKAVGLSLVFALLVLWLLVVLYRKWLPRRGHGPLSAQGNRWTSARDWAYGLSKKHWGKLVLFIVFLPIICLAVYWGGLLWIASMDKVVYGTPMYEWGITPRPSIVPDQVLVTPLDESEIRKKYFVEGGPLQEGWQTLPLEVEGHFPVDGKEYYTGLNIALLQGSRITVDVAGYCVDSGYKPFIHAGKSPEKTVGWSSGKEFIVTGDNNVSGAMMIRLHQKWSNIPDTNPHIRMCVEPKPGQIRIATWKIARESVYWGKLPPGNWELYFRFADEAGKTLSPDIVRQHPAALVIADENGVGGKERIISEPEGVYGSYIAQIEGAEGAARALKVIPPLLGKSVRVEIILSMPQNQVL